MNPSSNNTACAIMKRKRAHDEKLILRHEKKDQPLPKINDDDDEPTKTLEVYMKKND